MYQLSIDIYSYDRLPIINTFPERLPCDIIILLLVIVTTDEAFSVTIPPLPFSHCPESDLETLRTPLKYISFAVIFTFKIKLEKNDIVSTEKLH